MPVTNHTSLFGRRDFIRIGSLGALGINLAGVLRAGGKKDDLLHRALAERRSRAPGHLGSEARRTHGVPRRVQAHPDQRARHTDLRAPALHREAGRQVHHPALHALAREQPRARHQLSAHGLPAALDARISQHGLGHFEGTRTEERTAALRRHAQHVSVLRRRLSRAASTIRSSRAIPMWPATKCATSRCPPMSIGRA